MRGIDVMKPANRGARLRVRVVLREGAALGPGKADLLEGIRESGSISAAGRRMRMSYKRAWQLVDELNGLFREPLVRASTGGSGGGGAILTPLGEEVLARFRRIEARSSRASASEMTALRARLARKR